ncbi:hypothetical protein DRO61_05280 [Candidatus Bathyarchaeota archaeon]|nr:MAG: hypothetical protein DRO61_05280 [Candidatus Bathyarchaeota archaeon]
MDINTIIEIGSKADIILRFKADININGKDYLADEPYLFIRDASVVINYSNQDKTGTTDTTVVAYSDIKPRTVQIGNITFSRKLASMISTFVSTEQEFTMSKFDSVISVGSAVFPTEEIDETEPYFVYDINFDIVAAVAYNATNQSLESPNFVDDDEYIIYYSSVDTGTRFNLINPHIPYMSLEIQGQGNIDKITKKVVMYFDKVSLNAIMQFTFMQDTIMNIPLNFHIIDDKNNYVIFED